MKPITKRLAQMATLYAAKKIWDSVDADALQSLARDLYRSTPQQWQQNASQFASNSVSELQSNALSRFDDVINQAGLIRLANVPSRRGPMVLALVGGAVVGVAGTMVFLRSETGKSFMKKMSQKVDDMRSESSDEEDASEDASVGMSGRQTIKRSDSTIRKPHESTNSPSTNSPSTNSPSTNSPLHPSS